MSEETTKVLENQTDRILSEIANWSDSEFHQTFGFERLPELIKKTYRGYFDSDNHFWNKCPGYNPTFIRSQQQWANIRLKQKGHLFLNEVYDILGFERTTEGQISGWLVAAAPGNVVDFGVPEVCDFNAGYERDVSLVFNVLENIHYYI